MLSPDNCRSSISPDSFRHNKKCIHKSESTLSTNRETFYNKNSLNSNRTFSHNSNYSREDNNLFSALKKNEEKSNIKSFYMPLKNQNNVLNAKRIVNKKINYNYKYKTKYNNLTSKEKIEKNDLYSNNNFYHFQYRNNNYLNNKNNTLNKTINILNLSKSKINDNKVKPDISINKYIFKNKNNIHNGIIISRNYSHFNGKEELYNNSKIKKNTNLIRKTTFTKNNNSTNKKSKYINKNKKIDFDSEKIKLELIKKHYISNKINTQKLIYELKNNFNKINNDNKKILDLNDKCLKYSDLIQPDYFFKYREENKKNLKKYKPKPKKIITKRPLSYNHNEKNERNNKIKINKEKNINKKKYFSAENIKRKDIKEKREIDINKRILNVLQNDYKNNKIKNDLDYYNYLLNSNEEKKDLFYKDLEYKSKQTQNIINKNNRSSLYNYEINMSECYISKNVDKNLHLKYIYHPESDINQNLYIQRNEENNKNYYINPFSYRRKNNYLKI